MAQQELEGPGISESHRNGDIIIAGRPTMSNTPYLTGLQTSEGLYLSLLSLSLDMNADFLYLNASRQLPRGMGTRSYRRLQATVPPSPYKMSIILGTVGLHLDPVAVLWQSQTSLSATSGPQVAT